MADTVAVFGSFMMDLVAHAPRRPLQGETLTGTDFAMRTGGKGFNQAVAARRAGVEVEFVGMVGADSFGHQFLAELRAGGIGSDQVSASPEHGTGVGLPLVLPSGDNSIVIVPRANLWLTPEHAEAAASAIHEANVLLLQLEVPEDGSLRAAQIARESGSIVILNPAPFTAIDDELLQAVDVVVPNEIEAKELLGIVEDIPADDLADALAGELTCSAVLTAGENGVFVIEPGKPPVHIVAHIVEVVDTVGAGDTFCGNLGARLAKGDDLLSAARYANAAAGVAVSRPGGAEAAPTPAEVNAFLGRQSTLSA